MKWGSYQPGDRVELRYSPEKRRHMRRHGQIGTIEIRFGVHCVRPFNYGVRLDGGELVVVPRGHLKAYVPSPLFGEGW